MKRQAKRRSNNIKNGIAISEKEINEDKEQNQKSNNFDWKSALVADIGMWKNGTHFVSRSLNASILTNLGRGTKMFLWKNKYKQKGDNRPDYVLKAYNKQAIREMQNQLELRKLKTTVDPITVISLDNAVEIARDMLYDMQHGYSIDDLVVEVESFMRDYSFEAISTEDNE